MAKQRVYEPMTPEDIFQAAYIKRPCYNLKPPEDALYCRAALMYDRFRHEELTPEQGETERALAMALYMRAKEDERAMERTLEASGDLFRRVELAVSAYRAAPGKQTADALIEAIYKVPLETGPWEDEETAEEPPRNDSGTV